MRWAPHTPIKIETTKKTKPHTLLERLLKYKVHYHSECQETFLLEEGVMVWCWWKVKAKDNSIHQEKLKKKKVMFFLCVIARNKEQ